MTADFCVSYLGTLCISILQQEKRCLCRVHVIYASRKYPKSKILDTHVGTSDFGAFILEIPLYCKCYRIFINYSYKLIYVILCCIILKTLSFITKSKNMKFSQHLTDSSHAMGLMEDIIKVLKSTTCNERGSTPKHN
jgi:hypothetical protein